MCDTSFPVICPPLLRLRPLLNGVFGPLLVSGRVYDAELTQPIHHQLDSNCGKQDPNTISEMPRSTGFMRLDSLSMLAKIR